MQITIRNDDRAEGDSLQDYRRKQAEAWLQRNQKQLRDQFWARKREEHEAGQRWLAERGLTE